MAFLEANPDATASDIHSWASDEGIEGGHEDLNDTEEELTPDQNEGFSTLEVLVTSPSGVSEALHDNAPRAEPTFVVCELICQKPSVSVHPTEAAALKHAVQCAVENLMVPDANEIEARSEFELTLTDYDRICEGDYEVHILTPTNL